MGRKEAWRRPGGRPEEAPEEATGEATEEVTEEAPGPAKSNLRTPDKNMRNKKYSIIIHII